MARRDTKGSTKSIRRRAKACIFGLTATGLKGSSVTIRGI